MTLKPQDNSVDSIKTLTNRLVEIKYLHLIKTALEIAKRVNSNLFFPPNNLSLRSKIKFMRPKSKEKSMKSTWKSVIVISTLSLLCVLAQ